LALVTGTNDLELTCELGSGGELTANEETLRIATGGRDATVADDMVGAYPEYCCGIAACTVVTGT